ncbi:MAG: ABC transporter permease [Acidimicrobiales bacterium]
MKIARWVAGSVAGVIVLIALAGPWLLPGSVTSPVRGPFESASSELVLGTDVLGRDVLTRVLAGGRVLVLQAVAATLLGSCIGIGIGSWSGVTRRRRVGQVVLRIVDALASFPALLLLLLFAAAAPDGDVGVFVAMALVSSPFAVRVSHQRVVQLAATDYAREAEARGDGLLHRVRFDILPGLAPVAYADAGIRFLAAMQLAGTAGFLGLGAGTPSANWGRMVRENLTGISANPLPVLVPAALLMLLALGISALLDDAAALPASGATGGAS